MSWLTALVAVPLYFNPQSARVFDPDKMALIAVFGILAGLALALRWAESGLQEGMPSLGTLHMGHGLALLGIASFLSYALAGLVSETPQVAIWGAYRRAMGLIGHGAFLILFLSALFSASKLATRKRFRVLALAPAVPAASYALLQRLGIDSLQWDTYGSSAAERAFGPLGNPIFLGAYLAMIVPLAVSGWLDARRDEGERVEGANLQSYGFALVALVSTAGLLASQSRGPLLGWLSAIGILALLVSVQAGKKRLAQSLATVGGLGLILLAWASQSGMLGGGRLGGLFSLGSRTVRERMLVWEGMESLLSSDPSRALLGYGPDSLAYHLPRHLDAALIQLTPNQYFDRAHNALWEAWVSGGLIAVLAYLGLYLAAFGAGYKQLGMLPDRTALGKLLAWMSAGAALGALLPRLLSLPALSAPGLMAGWLAGAIFYALFSTAASRSGHNAAKPVASSTILGSLRGADALVIGILAMLGAHLTESALGLPTAAGDLLFWVGLGVLGAGMFRPDMATGSTGIPAVTTAGSKRRKKSGKAERKRSSKRAGTSANEDSLIADGLAEGAGLAAIAMAPILLPSFAAAWGAWPVFLLVPAAWLSMDLLCAPLGWRIQRILARLGGLALFALVFVPAKTSLGGVAIAFALVVALAALAAAFATTISQSSEDGAQSQPWRYIVYVTISALVLIGIWRLALRPVVADTYVRAALESVAQGNLDLGQSHYDSALRIWPEQPLLHVQSAALLDQRMQLDAGEASLMEAAYTDALAALQRARALGEDEVVLLRIASLHQTRGDLERAAGRSPARFWGLARQAYADTQALHPNYPPAYFGLATLLERLEQYAAAGPAYTSAGTLDAGMAAARTGALRCALAAGDQAKAMELAEAVLPVGDDPNTVLALLEPAGTGLPEGPNWPQARAMILAIAGDVENAKAALSQAENMAPQHPNLGWLRTWLAEREGS